MSLKENEILREKLEELISSAILALLTPKKAGSWQLSLESRAIKKITSGYRFLILRLNDMFDQLSGAVVFSKIDLRGCYYRIKFHLGDE